MMRYFLQILILVCIPRMYGVTGSCGETDPKSNPEIACDGQRIDLVCPKKSPWIKIQMAQFGREQPESHICARDPTESKNNTGKPTYCPFVSVLDKVSNICMDRKEKCNFKVTFNNPCPNVYNYLVVVYICMCTRRFSRNDQPSSSSCIPRPSSDLPTTHFPTLTLAMIGSTMSQNTSSTVYHQPITFSTTTPAPSRPYLSTISPNTTTHVTTMISTDIPKAKGRTTKKAFLFCLELIIIYHETFYHSPAMAMIWCFVGMLFGFFIITSVFLFYYLRSRNSEDKRLTRIRQLVPDEGNAASPTIETASSGFPHSRQDNDGVRCEIQSNQRGDGQTKSRKAHFSAENNSSSPTASNGNIFIFTNPLWRGLNKGERSSTTGPDESKSSEEVTETADTTLINRSEPAECNSNVQSEPPETSSGHSDSEPRENRKADNNDDRSIKDNANKQRRKNDLQLDTELTPIIPVGIPSSRVSVDELLARGDQKCSDSAKRVDSENSEEHKGSPTKPKPRGSIGENQPTNGLLAKFGIETDVCDANYNKILSDPCSILVFSETARSSPSLYNRTSNGEIFRTGSLNRSYGKRKPDNVHACSAIARNNGGDPAGKANDNEPFLQTRPSRSFSLDSGYPSAIPKFTEPPSYSDATAKLSNEQKQIRAGAEPTRKTSSPGTEQTSFEKGPNEGLSRSSAQENDTKTVPRILLEVPGDTAHGNSLQSGDGNFEQPATISRKTPKRRASSGYYSNNPSPSPEHSVGFDNTQNLLSRQKNGPQKKQGNELRLDLKQKQGSLNPHENAPAGQTGDDLPPLPPTPLLLPPPSFLPHLPPLGSQPRESQEDRKQRSPSGTRKVRFEPKTQKPLKEKVSRKK